MIVLRRRAIFTVASTALLGACMSESPSPGSPLAPSASTEFQLSSDVNGATIQTTNQWTALASLPFPRSHTVTAAANGRLYTIGGTNGTVIFNTVNEYNPSSNTWTTKAPMPRELNSQLGATLIGSRVYVPGGWDGTSYQSSLFIYDPVANSWSAGPSMPTPGACGGSVAIGGILYVAIGCDFSGVTGKLLKYDPVTTTWTRLPNAPGTHSGGTVFTVNGNVYWDASTAANGIDVYNPATNGWTPGPPHVTRRFSHVSGVLQGVPVSAGGWSTSSGLVSTEYMDDQGNRWASRANMFATTGTASAAVLGGEWYVIGGLLQTKTLATVQKYTPGDYWLTASSMPTPRGHLAAASINTTVFAIGGRLPSGTIPLATHEAYSAATGNWTALAPLPSALWGAAAASVGGTVYVIGGFSGDSGSTATSTVYAYSPGSNSWTTKASA
ncbi:MAG: kelch repeat-containing protein, partial [Gemmatimonadaceae bacterium]